MAKRLGVLGAAIALMALAIGVVSPALGSSGDDDKERTFRVVSENTEESFLDLGDKGFSIGDEFVFSSNLLKGNRQVGHSGVVCTLTSLEREEALCVGTFQFRGGQIAAQVLIPGEPEQFTVAITGGTGKYEGAEGEIVSRPVSEGREVLTFHLKD